MLRPFLDISRLQLMVNTLILQLLLQLSNSLLHHLHLLLDLRRDSWGLGVDEDFRVFVSCVSVHLHEQISRLKQRSEQRITGSKTSNSSRAVNSLLFSKKTFSTDNIEMYRVWKFFLCYPHEVRRVLVIVVEAVFLHVQLVQLMLHVEE